MPRVVSFESHEHLVVIVPFCPLFILFIKQMVVLDGVVVGDHVVNFRNQRVALRRRLVLGLEERFEDVLDRAAADDAAA